MSQAAIELINVSKSFKIFGARPRSVKSFLIDVCRGRVKNDISEQKVVLDNVSFSVGKGEILGIMGRNGTGKSTLMRILSGIYQPDAGKVRLSGTAVPLVGLGAGFHPDLTGLENIYLNGAILGIPRKELASALSSIVKFSELEKYMDLPVRNYSSGMVVRLGFSIAVHVNAPIILLDEVLAVGDEGFQRKCLIKLKEVFQSGRTVVMVSHDPSQVRAHCQRCIVLENGKKIFDGSGEEGADCYSSLFR